MKKQITMVLLAAAGLMPLGANAEVSKLNIPLGAGGFGFLPLYMMKEHKLIEKYAEKAGQKVTISWANIGGPSVMIDALLSGSADFISAGPPSFLLLWDRTKGTANVKGVAAISSMPMYLNTRVPHLKSIDDLKQGDKIAVTSVKSSIPSIVMQMYAMEKYGKDQVFRFDPYTVTMKHSDAAVSLISGSGNIAAHYASSPLAQREMKTKGVRTIQNSDDVMGGSTTFTMVSTTTAFHDKNPKIYAAFVAALQEAQDMIKADKQAAAKVLIASMGGGGDVTEMVAILNDPSTKYTAKPEKVMKYAKFMNDIKTIKNRPETLADLFFPGPAISAGN
ncbi:ABC transporter substrate-binding protein [Paralcaligenes ureilyticus]|uniref:NitT/TauT family transport system substrate-binding protein n=1 Tax=Paralcaligenes ureilyticus TaxID=627131 RepID=A0A4R3MDP8_9BURK|nr:PhnD/SsuA/transferrin family substrate-binding protein [Paralcaligenes ureilyticus]TCT11063.1 NitT/TauT family transport system substrate-binding protein [Paralcaligenes ureilyticus]